jgi:orotate phosphoribosyltransferase
MEKPVTAAIRPTAAADKVNNLFRLGHHILSSGVVSPYKIDCDALLDEDWECIAWLLARLPPTFGSVEGVPTGGLKLAEQMRRYKSYGKPLIVDDVYTTGASMLIQQANRDVRGAVVFSRVQRVLPWVTPLFTMTEAL